jgi:hypothetical protein
MHAPRPAQRFHDGLAVRLLPVHTFFPKVLLTYLPTYLFQPSDPTMAWPCASTLMPSPSSMTLIVNVCEAQLCFCIPPHAQRLDDGLAVRLHADALLLLVVQVLLDAPCGARHLSQRSAAQQAQQGAAWSARAASRLSRARRKSGGAQELWRLGGRP